MATLELSDYVKRQVEEYVREHVYTSIPARVINVSSFSSQQTVDIQPQIIDTFKDDRNIELPPILDVPVVFPSAGGGILSFPIKTGDIILAVFSMKSIDEWMNGRGSDKTFTPSDKRSYNINDAIAIPGLHTKNTNLSPSSTDVELKFSDSSISIDPQGNISIVSNNDVDITTTGNLTATVNGGQADVTASTINLNGNVNISGNLDVTGSTSLSSTVTSNGVNISDTHIHPATPPSSPTDFSGTPQ